APVLAIPDSGSEAVQEMRVPPATVRAPSAGSTRTTGGVRSFAAAPTRTRGARRRSTTPSPSVSHARSEASFVAVFTENVPLDSEVVGTSGYRIRRVSRPSALHLTR